MLLLGLLTRLLALEVGVLGLEPPLALACCLAGGFGDMLLLYVTHASTEEAQGLESIKLIL